MIDVALYGHLVLDTIIDKNKTYSSFGGIANLLQSLDYRLKVSLLPLHFGEATIFLDRKRTSKNILSVNLNRKTFKIKVPNARWHHIAYLNSIEDTSFIYDINSGIVSADLNDNLLYDFEALKKLDFLFISEEEFGDKWQKAILDNLSKNSWLIVHSPSLITAINKQGVKFSTGGEKISGINVLGAGDFFAGQFISLSLNKFPEKSLDILNIINSSYNNTTNFLINRDEKI